MCVIKEENSISALPNFSPEKKNVKNLGNREEKSKMSQISVSIGRKAIINDERTSHSLFWSFLSCL